jgi:hypothetical protein
MMEDDKKREMMEKIKHEIKQNAAIRRERSQALSGLGRNSNRSKSHFVLHFESRDFGTQASCSTVTSGCPFGDDTARAMEDQRNGDEDALGARPSSKENRSNRFLEKPGPAHNVIHPSANGYVSLDLFSHDLDYETDFIMKYLDYVFPFLFPFYRPAVFETGRSWLLSLLRNSRIAFHSALSLTSYFFTIALTDAYGDKYADCTKELWNRLEKQINLCFEIMRRNMLDLDLRDDTATTCEKVLTLESITQMLMFEVAIGKSADWSLHLRPALALLRQVMGGVDSLNHKLITVLHSIGRPMWYKSEYDNYVWNPDQAGFRFFAALLIFIDIIASTALRQCPELIAYHSDLLDERDDGAPVMGFAQIRLSAVVGCVNSVIVAIGQIAALDAWKQSMRCIGSLSTHELHERASSIHTFLNSTLEALEARVMLQQPEDHLYLPFQPYTIRSSTTGPSIMTTRIWAYAAHIYLAVVVSGSNSSEIDVRSSVSRILELVQTVPSNHFRTLAWPLCVAGCFASVDQEQGFRDVFTAKKDLELIGSLNEAQRVMEKVWNKRSMMEKEMWDLTACFSILGKPVLLI